MPNLIGIGPKKYRYSEIKETEMLNLNGVKSANLIKIEKFESP